MALKGPGRLPLPKNLINKSPEQLIGTLKRFGLDIDMADLQNKADASYNKRLAGVIKEGIMPDDATMQALVTQHEKDFVTGLRQMTKEAIRGYRVAKLEVAQSLMWVDVGDSEECKSCRARHNKVKTFKQWSLVGLPGSSALVCGANCRCELVPVN